MAQNILLSVLLVLSFNVVASDYVIDDIQFLGNKNTRDEVLLRELGFTRGAQVPETKINRGRQAIMALGLFASVKTSLEPTQTGHRLLVIVREKQFFLTTPVLNISGDGDRTYGVTSRAENLFGLNQQLKASVKRKQYRNADIKHESRVQLSYRAPRIANSRFDMELAVYRERALLHEQRSNQAGRYERHLSDGLVSIATPLGFSEPYKSWTVSVGLQRQDFEHTFLAGSPGLFFDASVYGLISRIEKKNIALLSEGRDGWHYGYELRRLTTANRTLYRHLGFYHSYQHLGSPRRAQIHVRVRVGSCSESVFGEPCFNLGGDATIRGIRRGSLRGNSFILTYTQLLVPLLPGGPIKGSVFADVGAAQPHDQANPAKLSGGLGVGIMWRAKRFVRTDIRLEVARGLGRDGKSRFYAATSMLF